MRERLPDERDGLTRFLEKLPIDRAGITHHFVITHKVGEEVKIFDAYLTVNCYEDGRVGEFFLKAGRDSNVHAMFDVWAISTSRLLQRGEPLEFMQKFVGIRQEPSGFTNNKDIPTCASVVDYVAKYLLKRFGKNDDQPS
jgi:ribonucleoside-diphosphate reductase alpha chain